MNTWHSKSLGDGISAPLYMDEIETLFQPMFESSGKPVDMAVFTRHEQGPLHCEVVAYFSPAATEVAKALAAQRCEPPATQDLELLAGMAECWPMIFR